MRTLPRLAVAGILALALALRLFHLTTQNLWFDEIESARIATTPIASLIAAIRAGSGIQPTAWLSPLYYAVLKSVLLLGHGSVETTLRASSMVLGVALVPALAWTALPLVPGPVVVIAVLFAAVSPFHVWYSQEVRPYALLVLLATIAVGAFARALDTNRFAWWGAAVLAIVLALYTHPIGLALLAVCAVSLAFEALGGATRPFMRGVGACALSALLFLPAVALARSLGANNAADVRPVTMFDPLYAFYAYAVGFSLGPSTAELHGPLGRVLPEYAPTIAAAAGVFGALFVAGIARALRLRARARTLLLAWLAVPMLLALAVAAVTRNPFNVRYAIAGFPAFPIVLALGGWSLLAGAGALGAAGARRRRGWRTSAGIALVGAVLALSGLSLHHLYFDARYAKEDCRALGAVLRAEAEADDVIVVNASYMHDAVRYYYAGPATVIGYPRGWAALDPVRAAAELPAPASAGGHVWLVLTRTFHGDRDGVLRRVLAAGRTEDREYRFPGVVAYRFGPPSSGSG
jgi:4-amino-4-deoxy-L-arabinose transferase-like glycosyltransferase